MALSNELITQFAKMANSNKKQTKSESTISGTVVYDGKTYVKFDGSDLLTPVDSMSSVKDGDRVNVLLKNHTATIIGNMSDPAASSNTVTGHSAKIAEFDTVIADKVSVKDLEAERARINTLIADNVVINEKLVANDAIIETLEADNVTINEKLTANEAYIKELDAEKIDASTVEATYATIENLKATNADIYNLTATYGEFKVLATDKFAANDAAINNLTANKADVKDLHAVEANVEALEADKADITDLNAVKGSIDVLDAGVADINTLIFGSASGESISTNFANAVIAQLGDAQIKSAMIESIAAGQITAGDIITNNVRVMSEDGSLLISDETIQISDENRVRVQIGKDAVGDYSINIWDADGKLMFSEGGITDSAIKDAIIRNDMVSDTANISAKKLDISSLFTVINEDGSNTLNSSKILIDADNQTLDVAFKNMTTKVETIGNTATQAQAAANQNAADMAAFVTEFNSDIDNLQTQIDGSITTWFYEVPPSSDKEPEVSWTTVDMKNNHLGDLYYDTITGYCYRYQIQNNEYSWQRISDTDITKALAEAQAAQDTADQKRRVFYNQPTPPYEQGDLWVQGSEGDILRCQTPKTASQGFAQSDWVLASKYTDDTAADAAMNKANETAGELVTVKETVTTQGTNISTIQGQINSKIWQQDITSAVTTLKGEVTETTNELSTKYSELDQTLDGIASTVAEHTTKISEKADSATVTEVSDKVSELEQDVSGFKTTVSETYATKNDLSDVMDSAEAAQDAADKAQKAADDADAKAAQAQSDLEAAEKNLESVSSRVGVTEEEIAAAQEAVNTAQQAADKAKQDAANAQQAADDAQDAANNAQAAADKAQEDVDKLAGRVSTAETTISQTSEQLLLMATKTEVEQTLSNYYTIEQAQSEIDQRAEQIALTVKSTVSIGAKNLIRNSETMIYEDYYFGEKIIEGEEETPETGEDEPETIEEGETTGSGNALEGVTVLSPYDTEDLCAKFTIIDVTDPFSLFDISRVHQEYTFTCWIKSDIDSKITIQNIETEVEIEEEIPEEPETVEEGEEPEVGEENVEHKITVTSIELNTTTEWTQLRATFNAASVDVPILFNDATTYYIYHPQLEIGNTPSDWDRAPEDISDDIFDVEASIKLLEDSILSTVTDENGQTKLVQTSTGWEFTITEKSELDKVSDALDGLKGDIEDYDIGSLQTSVNDVVDRTSRISVGTYKDPNTNVEEPCIELGGIVEGETADTVFKVVITNTKIMFLEDTYQHTYIDTHGLVTDNITVEEELIQKNDNVSGYFVWKVRNNGNYGLMWKEG